MAVDELFEDDSIEGDEGDSQDDGSSTGTISESEVPIVRETMFGIRQPRQPRLALAFGHLCRQGLMRRGGTQTLRTSPKTKTTTWCKDF